MPRPTIGHETASGPTKNRNFKCPPGLWAKLTRKAASEGKPVSLYLRELIERDVEDDPAPAPLSESA